MLSWDAVEQLHASGIAIESHTHRHPDLRMLRDDDIETECATADALIERRLGRQPRYFAYPFGHHDARVCGRVAARYAAAFTTSLGFLSPRDERARLPRVDAYYLRPSLVHRHPTAPATRAYLRLRKLLRLIRGTE
jgi:peptidoglycan/xylan/chitin deacetylase (PgdA/CDA1 family)